MDKFDVCIIGAGVVGLAIARQFLCDRKATKRKLVLLERDASFGQGSSSRNSEVIHAGLYYPPASLKAALCVSGNNKLYAYCEQFKIPHRRTGKLIVAQKNEEPVLDALRKNAEDCGVTNLTWHDRSGLARLESAISAEFALHSPDSGIIDSHAFMQSLLHQAGDAGLIYAPRTRARKIELQADGFLVRTEYRESQNARDVQNYSFSARTVINSCGLWAQDLAQNIQGLDGKHIPRLYPCKGSYFEYQGRSPFQRLVYPVPEAGIKGLGIHGTLDLSGRLRFGPHAEYVDTLDYTVDPQLRDIFATAIRRYFPSLEVQRMNPGYSGIRPKLSAAGEGFADFVIQDESRHGLPGLINLFGIESPGLTASLSIGDLVSSKLSALLD